MRRRELVLLALSNVMAVWSLTGIGYGLRTACAVPSGFYEWISQYIPYLCYSDLYTMWAGRQLYLHVPPYIVGTFVPPDGLGNGAVEYPVFSGLAMWLTALPSTTYDDFFLISTIVAGLLATCVALALVFLVGNWAYVWSFSPLLLLYASYNWDLYPVLATVLGFAFVLRGPVSWSDRKRGVAAAVLFGIGCLFKLYPALFVLPLALWLALRRGGDLRDRVAAAARPVLITVGVVIAGNLPFAILGFEGWMASFRFQSYRAISGNTLSIWYWWTLPFHDANGIDGRYLALATAITSLAILCGCALAFWLGWRRFRSTGDFPWIGVAGAMAVSYMLLGKVDSPQYGLWLIPFFVVLAIPLWAIVAYTAANLLLYTSWFHPAFLANLPWNEVVTPALVTVNAVMLGYSFVSFVQVGVRPLFDLGGGTFASRFGAVAPGRMHVKSAAGRHSASYNG